MNYNLSHVAWLNCHWHVGLCHWTKSSHCCDGSWCHWNVWNYSSNDEALYLWSVSVHTAQYTPVSRHTRYSILACCTAFTSFSEPSSSSSPGHTKTCIRFMVCSDKVYCSNCGSTGLHATYTHFLPIFDPNSDSQQPPWHSWMCWKIIWKFCLGFHVWILVLHTCCHVSASFSLFLSFGLPTALVGFHLWVCFCML